MNGSGFQPVSSSEKEAKQAEVPENEGFEAIVSRSLSAR
jgi:hypothetical protein